MEIKMIIADKENRIISRKKKRKKHLVEKIKIENINTGTPVSVQAYTVSNKKKR